MMTDKDDTGPFLKKADDPFWSNQSSNGDSESSYSVGFDDWEFTDPGKEFIYDDIYVDEEGFKARKAHEHNYSLGQFTSTAISGNDITSSCFYTIGLVTISSGKWAPISLLLVSLFLFLYKYIYAEVGSALPMNGGTYNILLNTTFKMVAAVAASLTILSYVSTAVVSANTAMSYANMLCDKIPIIWATVGVLALFGVLCWIGLGESSVVALSLFCLHITTLIAIVIMSVRAFIINGTGMLVDNWSLPSVKSPIQDIYFGFCTGLLGVSGFETSSNYIEEQAEGVFPKTLRNMAILLLIFNPTLAFLNTALLPVSFSIDPHNQLLVLGELALVSGGQWFRFIVGIDSVLVLSGAVLTSYIGVIGLIRRISLDHCLPQFLLAENKLNKTNHWIILLFFLLTSSLYLMVHGDIIALSGVYTISFLSVMALFAVGNILLKYKRSQLARKVHAPIWVVILGLTFVILALIGNVIMNSVFVVYFSLYFLFAILVLILMLTRVRIVRWLSYSPLCKVMGNRLQDIVRNFNRPEMVFFAKTEDISVLNKAILYVRDNELTSCLRIVHVYQKEEQIPSQLRFNIKILDEIYRKMKIDLYLVKGQFTPAMVEKLSEIFDIPINFMYITMPSCMFPHQLGDFGGVRMITH